MFFTNGSFNDVYCNVAVIALTILFKSNLHKSEKTSDKTSIYIVVTTAVMCQRCLLCLPTLLQLRTESGVRLCGPAVGCRMVPTERAHRHNCPGSGIAQNGRISPQHPEPGGVT